MKEKTRKDWIWVGTVLLLIWFGLTHVNHLIGFAASLWKILSPFLLGAALAFVLNVPMRFLETKALKWMPPKAKRPTALVLTLAITALVVYLVMALVIPEVTATVRTIIKAIPGAIARLEAWLATYDFQLYDYIRSKIPTGAELENHLGNLLNIALKGVVFSGAVIGSVYQNVLSGFFTIMFTLYFLLGKEHLREQFSRFLGAVMPADKLQKVMKIASLSQHTLSSFITGQCLEAVILGALFFVTMTIFRFPYVLLISVFIAVTALIPVVGAWMGCIVGAFLILVGDPMQAVWFLVLFLVLQQLEGNIIYPRVMGNAIGLPSLWVLFAVVLGEGMFGIVGMLLFIPLMSVVYKLVTEWVDARLSQREAPTKTDE